jgi:exopolysaccharide production protein ExoQ
MRWRRLESPALWIAAFWVAIIGSRPVSYWLSYMGLGGGGGGSNLDGNPINLAIMLSLILAAFLVLARRGFDWGAFILNNQALCGLYVFMALSAFWSPYPFVSFRRLFKDFGCVPVALVFLTGQDPVAAIRTVYARVAYLLLPFSVLFYKYFPELGRTYSKGGEPMFSGVTTQKNTLGQMLLVFGLVLLVDTLELRRGDVAQKKKAMLISCGMLLIAAWLLLASHSQTSLVCAILGVAIIWAGRYLVRLRNPGTILAICLAVTVGLAGLEATFGVSKAVLSALGRDETLTGRTVIWEAVKSHLGNPLLGTGYSIFWDVNSTAVEEDMGMDLLSAHNGYLEIYCDGGLAGLAFLGIILFAGGLCAAETLLQETLFGRLAFAFWVILLVNNWSEASFMRSTTLWFVFLIVAMRCGYQKPSTLDVASPAR